MIPGLRERIHRRVSPHEVPFRFRGVEPTRTEALADAVIGFAITLAVVSLEVPRDSGQLLALVRSFGSFGLTFLVLFGAWLAHHRFCRRYGLEDDRTVWLSGALLFVIVFYTYPLKFVVGWLLDRHVGLPGPIVRDAELPWVLSLYGVGIGLVAVLIGLMYRHAHGLRDLLELDEFEVADTQLTARSWFSMLPMTALIAVMPALGLFRERTPRLVALLVFAALLVAVTIAYFRDYLRIRRERRALAARARAAEAKP